MSGLSGFLGRLACASALFAVACQKSDATAPMSPSSAGATSSAGTGVGGSDPTAGSSTLGGGGSGAAAASDGSGAAAATAGAGGADGIAGAPDSTQCDALGLTECASNDTCQGLSAQPITGDPLCLGAFQVVACGTKVGCQPKAARGRDAQGHDWIFPSTCIPASWTDTSPSGTRFDPCMAASGGAGGGSAGTGGFSN